MKMISYRRVSTGRQAASGLGLDAQDAKIQREAAYRDWELIDIVDGKSGKDKDREGFQVAMRMLERGEADGIVVAKLDRISRSVLDLAQLLAKAAKEGWVLVVLDLGVDTSTPNGRFMAHVMGAAAELEREMISERTKDALAVVRSRGVVLGNVKRNGAEVVARVQAMRASGMTLAAIAERLTADGTPTASGKGQWRASTVKGILDRQAVAA